MMCEHIGGHVSIHVGYDMPLSSYSSSTACSHDHLYAHMTTYMLT